MTVSFARTIGIVGAVCLLVQLVSATFFVRDFTTPNASTAIARNLIATGRYELIGGPEGSRAPTPRRAFQLPGEPLYLAAGFLLLPAPLQRYLHLPVTLLFVMAVTAVAMAAGGESLALVVGLIASLDPFVVAHGPIWDDTFLAAACDWFVFAVAVTVFVAATRGQDAPRSRTLALMVAIACLAGWAGVTRLQSQIQLGLAGVAIVVLPATRPMRWLGRSVLAGLAMAVGAWGVRNLIVLGVFFVGSSHDGQTLYQSVHWQARESIVRTGAAQTLLELPAHPGMGELGEDAVFAQQGWEYVRAQPRDVLATAAFKIAVSLSGYDFIAPNRSVRNVVVVGFNAILLLTAIWGWVRWPGQEASARVRWFLLLFGSLTALITCVLLALGPVGLRYRVSLNGFLYLGAGAAVVRIKAPPDRTCRV